MAAGAGAEPKHLRGLQVDDQFDFHCLLRRKVSRWFTLQDSRGVNTNLPTRLGRKLRAQLSRLYRSKSLAALSQRMASIKTST